jgi:hypothetical protein
MSFCLIELLFAGIGLLGLMLFPLYAFVGFAQSLDENSQKSAESDFSQI